jgi:hypothetical protein
MASRCRRNRDDLVRVFVDVADTTAHRQFFVQFKEKVKADFQQCRVVFKTGKLCSFQNRNFIWGDW